MKKIEHEFPDLSPIKLEGISQNRSSSGLQAAKQKLQQIDKTIEKKKNLQKNLEVVFNIDEIKLEKDIKSKETVKIWIN